MFRLLLIFPCPAQKHTRHTHPVIFISQDLLFVSDMRRAFAGCHDATAGSGGHTAGGAFVWFLRLLGVMWVGVVL